MSQPYSLISPGTLSQYVGNTHQNVAGSTSSTAFVSQPSKEIHHRPVIPSTQMPPLTKSLVPETESSTSVDTVKSELVKTNQSYQWTTNRPPINIPQGAVGIPGISSSIDKTSQVFMDQTAGSQTSFNRVNQTTTYDHDHYIPAPPSNVSLPPPNIAQHLDKDSQQDPEASNVQSLRTRNVQAQSTIGPTESLISSQLRYGSQQKIFSASSTPTTSSNTQNLFFNPQQGHNTGIRNPQDYNPQSLKLQQNLLSNVADSTGPGNIPQSPNVYRDLAGQRKYPQQDTANAAMLPPRTAAPPSGVNQLQVRAPPLGVPHPGQQMVSFVDEKDTH